jgi:hypothetical protein
MIGGAVLLGLGQAASAAPYLTTLYSFTGSNLDGGTPVGPLALDSAGNLYGISTQADVIETVFQLRPPANAQSVWTESTIYTTINIDSPPSGLTLNASGDLFGTTSGGYLGRQFFPGTVFELVPSQGAWTPVTLHNFDTTYQLGGNLLLAPNGRLYALTLDGGVNGGGTAFELADVPGTKYVKTTLVSLPATAVPQSDLTPDTCGHLFGTTTADGNGYGTVFALTELPGQGWVETIVYSFTGQQDGGTPLAGVAVDASGNLYGTTSTGGANGGGTAFLLSPPVPGTGYAWTLTTLYNFGALSSPRGKLSVDSGGSVYGTTGTGSTYGYGSVFMLTPPGNGSSVWTKSVVHAFIGANDGAGPQGGVIPDGAGHLYGTTSAGGANSAGTVFQITE